MSSVLLSPADIIDRQAIRCRKLGLTVADDGERAELIPEELLLLAILKRAYLDLTDKEQKRSAWRWFSSNSIQKWSYLWVCETLEKDAAGLRQTARRRYFNGLHREPNAHGHSGHK